MCDRRPRIERENVSSDSGAVLAEDQMHRGTDPVVVPQGIRTDDFHETLATLWGADAKESRPRR